MKRVTQNLYLYGDLWKPFGTQNRKPYISLDKMAAKGLIRITWLCGRPIKCDNSLKCCWELMGNSNVIVTHVKDLDFFFLYPTVDAIHSGRNIWPLMMHWWMYFTHGDLIYGCRVMETQSMKLCWAVPTIWHMVVADDVYVLCLGSPILMLPPLYLWAFVVLRHPHFVMSMLKQDRSFWPQNTQ